MSVNDRVFSQFLTGEGAYPLDNNGFWALDRRLPGWARRSNPIVRRHLGGFWKASLPALDELGWLLIGQLLFLLPALFWQAFLELISLAGLLSMFVLPIGLVYYVRAVVGITRSAAGSIISERQTQMLDLLRATPYPLRMILLSKAAAAVWRQMDNLSLLVFITAGLSLPPIVIQQATLYPPDKQTPIPQIMAAAGLLASVLRVCLEPLMAASVALVAGALADFEISATTWASLSMLAYAVLINLPRLLPMSWPVRLVVESILPVILPIVFTGLALHIAQRLLQRD